MIPRPQRRWLWAALVCVLPAAATAGVVRIDVHERKPFAAGHAYGNAGPYERIRGRFHGELDPRAPANAAIIDIHKASVNARGRLEYAADFDILKPVDSARGNGTLLYDVANRGSRLALALFNDAPQSDDPAGAGDAGNGFLMRHGFTIAWSGWEPGVREGGGRLRIDVPRAPGVQQLVWDEILSNEPGRLAARLAFASTDASAQRSVLYVLANHRAAPTKLAAGAWEYVDAQRVQLLPRGTAFPVGVIHQFTYPAADPPVSGIGFAATRDFVSALRHDAGPGNPLASGGRARVDAAIAHGNSQGGRYLRDFLYRGFNDDEAGRVVFDGLSVHLAAARIELNQRFAQPGRAASMGYGFRGYGDVSFPFAYGVQADPHGDRVDGLLAACSARGHCPKVMHTSTSSEYWQSGNSLVTTDPRGRRDVPLPAGVRVYQFAGTQHSTDASMPEGVCALPANAEIDARPAMRALLVALDRWVKAGTPPPRSAYPRIANGTLVAFERLRFPRIAGVKLPNGPNPRERFEQGPDGLPRVVRGRYAVLVPAVDRDGNETGGLRVPGLATPLGTATGWALRAATAGGGGELCYLDGMYLPFAATKAARLASGDPRLSLAERYRGKADYVSTLRRVAHGLAREGYLLEEDVPGIVERAEARAWPPVRP